MMDDSLTWEKLVATMKSLPKVPPPVIIYASAHWPTHVSRFQKRRFEAHPIIKWLARWFPITPYVETEYPIFEDDPAVIDQVSGRVYCSLRQEAVFKMVMQETARSTAR